MTDTKGIITVTKDGIEIILVDGSNYSKVGYTPATEENLFDACRILRCWMNIPSEDLGKQCKRIHDNEQFDAFLRDVIEDSIRRSDQ